MKQYLIILLHLSLLFCNHRAAAQVEQILHNLDSCTIRQLANGLKVIVVHKNDTSNVFCEVYIDSEPVLESEYKGYSEATAFMLGSGSMNHPRVLLEREFNSLQATFETTTKGLISTFPIQNFDTIYGAIAEIIQKPVFDNVRLNIFKQKKIQEIADEETNVDSAFLRMQKKILYKNLHPYGEIQNPQSFGTISVPKVEDFHKNYYKPNITYIVFIGNLDIVLVDSLSQKYFAKWEKGTIPFKNFNPEIKLTESTINFINRPDDSLSQISVFYPIDLKPNNPDALQLSALQIIMNQIVQKSAILQNASSFIAPDKITGSFHLSAKFEYSQISLATTEIVTKMNQIRDEIYNETKIQAFKQKVRYDFESSLRSEQNIAEYALNIPRYNIPKNFYTTYLSKIDSITPATLQNLAKKYISPQNMNILIASKRKFVYKQLVELTANHKINLLDSNIQVYKVLPKGFNAKDIFNDYLQSIGGTKGLPNIPDLLIKATGTYQVDTLNLNIEWNFYRKSNTHFCAISKLQLNDTTSLLIDYQILNPFTGYDSTMQEAKILTSGELTALKIKSNLFVENAYDLLGFRSELIGVDSILEHEVYKVLVNSPIGEQQYDYYTVDDNLKLYSEQFQQTDSGNIVIESVKFLEYKPMNQEYKVLIPFRKIIKQDGVLVEMTVQSVDTKNRINKEIFKHLK